MDLWPVLACFQPAYIKLYSILLLSILKYYFCPLQHNIEYQIVGTVPAPYYFKIDQRSGVVSIKNSVASGSDTTYTVTIPTLYYP